MAYKFTQVDFILETLDEMLTDKGEDLTKTVKVSDFLFDGISLQPYLDLLNDPLVQTAGQDLNLPPEYQDGLFSLFKGVFEIIIIIVEFSMCYQGLVKFST